jgi:alcohol dehydrogenase
MQHPLTAKSQTTDPMTPLAISFPGKLVFGNGCLASLAGEIRARKLHRVFLVSSKSVLPALGELITELGASGIRVEHDTSIRREPYYSDFFRVLEQARAFGPDAVLGIGGGSALDVAKLVAAQLESGQELQEIVGIGLLKSRSKTLICVPTTAGTGSEVSPNSILIDDEGQKKGIISPFLVPDLVYVDPLLTLSLPPDITAATGIDALTHCLEAYTNKFAQPLIDLYAAEGMRLIGANIAEAVQNGSNREARSRVAMGSLLGGFCLGPVNTAAVHA